MPLGVLEAGAGAGRVRLKPVTFSSIGRSLLLALGIACVAAAQPTSAVILSGKLAKWRDEIEALGKGKVILARVFTDRQKGYVFLPKDTEERPALLPYFRNTNFLKQLLASHGMNLNVKDGDRMLHFVLLNMAREGEWGGYEDAVIAHEFGHIWLLANDYPMPAYQGKKNSCLSTLTSDAVQHPMIRKLLRERKIDYNAYWIPLLERSLGLLEKAPVKPVEEIPTCLLMSKMVLWLDVKTGLTPEQWPDRDRFLAVLQRHYPILRDTVDDLSQKLAKKDLFDRDQYRGVLEETLYTVYGFVRMVLKRGE